MVNNMFKESILIIFNFLANPFYLFWVLAISIFVVFLSYLYVYLDSLEG